jgi:hypothetical protein
MRRLLAALIGSIGLTATTTIGAAADTGLTSVVLSCSDGHSVAMTVDQATLTSLLADVQALNLSGTNSCAVDTATVDPSSQTTDWTVFDYNSSGRALAPRNSPNKSPAFATNSGTTWNFFFQPNVYTALFTTTDPNMTGNLCPVFFAGCKHVTDEITVSGDGGSFMTQSNGGDCVSNFPAAVRFYFTAPSASGQSAGPPPPGLPPAGFYTKFWWSNPVNLQLLSGNQGPTPISADLGDVTQWSDWDGKSAAMQSEAFMEAVQKVQSIGLSFGGECFFETGVTPTSSTFTGEQFSSQFSET